MIAARRGIQAEDLPLNSYGIEQSETQTGDFEVMKYTRYDDHEVSWHHTVIFDKIDENNINRSSIVWGNPGTDLGGSVLAKGKINYPRFAQPSTQKWSILSGNLNSRWNVLNPANMLERLMMQNIELPKADLLKVDPIKIPNVIIH